MIPQKGIIDRGDQGEPCRRRRTSTDVGRARAQAVYRDVRTISVIITSQAGLCTKILAVAVLGGYGDVPRETVLGLVDQVRPNVVVPLQPGSVNCVGVVSAECAAKEVAVIVRGFGELIVDGKPVLDADVLIPFERQIIGVSLPAGASDIVQKRAGQVGLRQQVQEIAGDLADTVPGYDVSRERSPLQIALGIGNYVCCVVECGNVRSREISFSLFCRRQRGNTGGRRGAELVAGVVTPNERFVFSVVELGDPDGAAPGEAVLVLFVNVALGRLPGPGIQLIVAQILVAHTVVDVGAGFGRIRDLGPGRAPVFRRHRIQVQFELPDRFDGR